jgi:hypothetical protein
VTKFGSDPALTGVDEWACARFKYSVGSDGLIGDAGIRAALAEALRALVEHVRTRESSP